MFLSFAKSKINYPYFIFWLYLFFVSNIQLFFLFCQLLQPGLLLLYDRVTYP